MTLLEFTLRNKYGKDRYYPSNLAAQTIVSFTGRKCFKDVEVERLRYSGFEIAIKKTVLVEQEEI